MDFGHVITAMVTPFDQKGNVDLKKTESLIDYLLVSGTDALVVAGTTGESPTLSTNEKLLLIEHTIKYVNKRVPVIAGTGTNDTKYSIDLTKKATELGADGIMAVAPYYNKPSQLGMIAHFTAIANSTHLPVMLYNIPGRSVVNMTLETMLELSKVKNIVSMKEASGDLDKMAALIDGTGDDFSVYSGDDQLTLPLLAIGGNGVVSVASHVVGADIKKMVDLFINGNTKDAAALHRRLLPIFKGMFLAPNPTCLKEALRYKGMDVGGVRLPLVSLTEDEKQLVHQLFLN